MLHPLQTSIPTWLQFGSKNDQQSVNFSTPRWPSDRFLVDLGSILDRLLISFNNLWLICDWSFIQPSLPPTNPSTNQPFNQPTLQQATFPRPPMASAGCAKRKKISYTPLGDAIGDFVEIWCRQIRDQGVFIKKTCLAWEREAPNCLTNLEARWACLWRWWWEGKAR